MPRSLRLSLGMLSRLPVGDVSASASDRSAVGRAVAWAPVVGLLLAAPAAAVIAGITAVSGSDPGMRSLLLAALALLWLQWATSGLHADGLADTADGLACGRDPSGTRSVMKRSDVGPIGVLALMLTVLVQVAALAVAVDAGHGAFAVVVGAAGGRVALLWAATARPATSDGLGAWVALTVGRGATSVITAAAAGVGGTIGLLIGGPALGVAGALAPCAAAAVAAALLPMLRRRVGGITGDTLGASIELGTAVALISVAVV